MKKYLMQLSASIIILFLAYISHAIHEVVEIPPDLAGVGHYEKMPLASGGDVRHFITGHKPYKKEFKLWPGKGEMHKGTEPHGALLTTYVNDFGMDSIEKAQGMANNSMIVKENYAPNKKLVSLSVMYKVKGYNPEGGDWFWVQYDSNLKVMDEGKIKACLDCHSTAEKNDYIFSGTVKK